MSRKSSSDSTNGFNDVIGVALLVAALLLVGSQLSFDHGDISGLTTETNKPLHNWIGTMGAYFAWWFFSLFGLAAYLLPFILAAFGVAYLFGWLDYLRRRQIRHSRQRAGSRRLANRSVQSVPAAFWATSPTANRSVTSGA